MPGRLEGKVAFITGAARGQGRSHAVRLAQEGADILAVDLCAQIESVSYPLATPEDLAETAELVERLGRRIVSRKADVRERGELRQAVADGVAELGRLDIVVANAGILPMAVGDHDPQYFIDAADVDLLGVMNTVAVALPQLPDHSSVVVTGSTAAMLPGTIDNPATGPGVAGYAWAKKTLIGYTEQMALHLAPRFIRVNTIHPTNCDTRMLHNDGVYALYRPDLEQPIREDAEPAFATLHAMPIPYLEPVDISNLVLFLASDESRYITGQQIRVDAGALLKFPQGNFG
ncbi:mycofactocin-coupled SDR family oxidoreductase [Actinomadura madurae]|uniref:mycofactocin-coupled SDR family oxidoreductase n=1 Tax=Actinomadura madurae TaxID=1993 RepID=UPI00202640B2|nr:mycofactocin-coupled SDR family oxidoreductase [Actinomadura madurae]URM98370.1 mycofactocin-coupled SDR family oxidoreductase [Actinomadura madurae]URN09062.1 mycofactocin-coupled SDR family oxidoreductase [Actinomadura madurae]